MFVITLFFAGEEDEIDICGSTATCGLKVLTVVVVVVVCCYTRLYWFAGMPPFCIGDIVFIF